VPRYRQHRAAFVLDVGCVGVSSPSSRYSRFTTARTSFGSGGLRLVRSTPPILTSNGGTSRTCGTRRPVSGDSTRDAGCEIEPALRGRSRRHLPTWPDHGPRGSPRWPKRSRHVGGLGRDGGRRGLRCPRCEPAVTV